MSRFAASPGRRERRLDRLGRSGAAAYLVKPFALADLASRVEALAHA